VSATRTSGYYFLDYAKKEVSRFIVAKEGRSSGYFGGVEKRFPGRKAHPGKGREQKWLTRK
jgi:hypothetical protein